MHLNIKNCTDVIQPQKTARFWGPPQRFVYINRNKMICEFADGVCRSLIAAPDWIDGGTSLCTRGSTILYVSTHQSKPQYGRNMTLVSLSEPCYVTRTSLWSRRREHWNTHLYRGRIEEC